MTTARPPANILSGTDKIITDWFKDVAQATESFTTKTALNQIAMFRGDLRLPELLGELWRQIETNWTTAGSSAGGPENWQWRRRLVMRDDNDSEETALERGLSMALTRKQWANQVPMASGLISWKADHKRNLDLAYWDGAETVMLIELKAPKVDAKRKQTPLLAAFEIVLNGFLLCLARAHQTSEPHIAIAQPEIWRDSRRAHLRVVAPARFYDPCFSLERFERDLNQAVLAFRQPNSPEMTFAFRIFDLTAIFHDAVERSRAYPPIEA